jgi:hypothetical protein
MDDKRKHLEFIQSTIARLANNSFAYKGWAITVLVAVFALVGQGRGTDTAGPNTILAGLVPAFAFWVLDANCVRRERMFRALYDHVRVAQTTDYSMDASDYAASIGRTLSVATSRDLAALYGTLALLTVGFRLLRVWVLI